jgi:AcrR family transcriptional regulator
MVTDHSVMRNQTDTLPRPKADKQAASEERHAQILDAARAVFSRQSFAATVVEDIARDAGIGKGTLYLYFRSKEEIYVAAVTADARKIQLETSVRLADLPDFRQKLRAFLEIRLEYIESHQNFLRIYLAEFGRLCLGHSEMSSQFEEIVLESNRSLAEMLESAARNGEIRPVNIPVTSFAIHDLTRGMMERRLMNWSPLNPSEDLEFTFNLIMKGIAQSR